MKIYITAILTVAFLFCGTFSFAQKSAISKAKKKTLTEKQANMFPSDFPARPGQNATNEEAEAYGNAKAKWVNENPERYQEMINSMRSSAPKNGEEIRAKEIKKSEERAVKKEVKQVEGGALPTKKMKVAPKKKE